METQFTRIFFAEYDVGTQDSMLIESFECNILRLTASCQLHILFKSFLVIVNEFFAVNCHKFGHVFPPI